MTSPPPAPPREKLIRLIHFSLFAGVFLLATVLVVLRSQPNAPPATLSPVMGMVFAGVGALAIAIAFAILRKRIPVRGSDETLTEFWNPARSTAALMLWAAIEVGGLAGVVGYQLTAMWTPLALAPISLIAAYLVRPGALEGR
jgi:hypothetical protein